MFRSDSCNAIIALGLVVLLRMLPVEGGMESAGGIRAQSVGALPGHAAALPAAQFLGKLFLTQRAMWYKLGRAGAKPVHLIF